MNEQINNEAKEKLYDLFALIVLNTIEEKHKEKEKGKN
jgi:hypothetical protein